MFTLLGTDPSSKARCGILRTKRGEIRTPQFMPVGTQGSVKAVSPDELIPSFANNLTHVEARFGS